MTSVRLDTHAWAWSLTGDTRLPPKALAAIQGADTVMVSPIAFFKIAQEVRLGKWPEMTEFIDQLPNLLQTQGGTVVEFGPAICIEAGMMDWAHRDPFDRLIAAAAPAGKLPLVSADVVFDGTVARVW